MKTVDLDSWDDFPTAIADVRTQFGTREIEYDTDHWATLKNDVLFRGQGNSNWSLQTTLERTSSERFSVQRYMQRADSVVNEIESLTRAEWKLPTYPEIVREIESTQNSMRRHIAD